ncbi:MAG: LysE family translocator [Pseudomonadota bacterium]
MPGTELIAAFFLTVVLLAITPGPGLLYIAAQTVGRGPTAGWYSALGTHLASYVHILAAAFGISLLLQAVPAAYLALKIAGAAYLCWLGLRFFLAEEPEAAPHQNTAPRTHLRALKESFIVELANPKSAIFFLAFLPQFTDGAATFPFWVQIILLGLIANIIFSLAELCCVFFADQVSSILRRSKSAGRWMRRTAGSIMIALSARLLLSER